MDVRPARDGAELEQALDLRERVFLGEQGVDRPVRDMRGDTTARQLVAVAGERVLGTCRLTLDGEVARLGWMAVERGSRGRGVGAAILAAAERSGTEAGARLMQLYAQRKVEGFYASAGYAPRGEPFVVEGIAHISMEKRLA